MKNSKWIGFGRTLIVFFTMILFMSALALFTEIKRDISYSNRAYGLSVMDDYFNNGEYYDIYISAIKNNITDEEPAVDTSQYEAFGRLYNAYLMARSHNNDPIYLKQMENEKANIKLKKILAVVERLEAELENKN